MVIRTSKLETVCGITSKLPENRLPEAAFAGRSNVGKSSLINGLLNRRSLARVSSKPGKTQTINYYNVNDELYVVDLPGYGYTQISEDIKARWGRMVERYLRQSRQLRMVFLLVDMRHEPNANDIQMYNWIVSAGFSPAIIATKADKVKKNQAAKNINAIRKALGLGSQVPVIPWSAETKKGQDEIWALIEQYVLDVKEDQTSGKEG